MQKIYLLSRNRWIKEARKVGLEAEDCFNIEVNLCTTQNIQEINKIFLSSLEQIFKKGKIKDFFELNSFVRDFQAMVNHRVFQHSSGRDISLFLQEVILAKKEYGRHKPKNLKSFLELVYDSHIEIDKFFKMKEKELHQMYKDFSEKIKKSGLELEEENLLKEDYFINPSQISISHHILDWYLQLTPFYAYKKTPRKLAATAMYCMKRFNEEITGLVQTSFTNSELSQFGGWSSISGVVSYSVYYDILYGVEDLNLLIISPLSLNLKAKKKLEEIIKKREQDQDIIDIIEQ